MVKNPIDLGTRRDGAGRKNPDEAADHCDRAIKGFQELKAVILRAEAPLVCGRINAAADCPESALSAWLEGAGLLSSLDRRGGVSLSRELELEISVLSLRRE